MFKGMGLYIDPRDVLLRLTYGRKSAHADRERSLNNIFIALEVNEIHNNMCNFKGIYQCVCHKINNGRKITRRGKYY